MTAILVVMLLSTAGSATDTGGICASQWRISPTPRFTSKGVLFAVDAVSARDVWAVGATGMHSAGYRSLGRLLIEHWDGRRWTVARIPTIPAGTLLAVASVSARDVWAVGASEDRPLALRWSGGTWRAVPTPDVGAGTFYGVVAFATNDVWAIGSLNRFDSLEPPRGTLIEHWDGRHWDVVQATRDAIALRAIAGRGPNDIWAVGGPSKNGDCIEHWDGMGWKVVAIPMRGCALSGVAASARNNAWAVGGEVRLHWAGSRWTWIHLPIRDRPAGVSYGDYFFENVAAISSIDVWLVGTAAPIHSAVVLDYSAELRVHWDGQHWQVRSPWQLYDANGDLNGGESAELHGITALSSTELWAVGQANQHTLVEHYSCA